MAGRKEDQDHRTGDGLHQSDRGELRRDDSDLRTTYPAPSSARRCGKRGRKTARVAVLARSTDLAHENGNAGGHRRRGEGQGHHTIVSDQDPKRSTDPARKDADRAVARSTVLGHMTMGVIDILTITNTRERKLTKNIDTSTKNRKIKTDTEMARREKFDEIRNGFR